MDFDRYVSRVSGVCALVYALVNPIALWLHVTLGDATGEDVEPRVLIIGSIVVLAGAIWFLLRPTLDRRIAWFGRHHQLIDLAQMLFFVAVIATLAASSGGIYGLQWFYLIFVVIFSAMTLPFFWSLGLGVVSGAAFLAAAAAAGQIQPQQAGLAITVVGGLALLSYFTAMLARGLRLLQEAAETEREELKAQVATLSVSLVEVATGDLSVRLSDTGPIAKEGDAATQMAVVRASLDHTIGAVSAIVSDVQEASNRMASSVSDLHLAATDAATGYAQQSAAIVQTTTSMEELAATAGQIAESAQAVSEAADEVTTASTAAQSVVIEATRQMLSMADQVQAISTEATTLHDSSEEIDRILRVIDELADQTNLLALNAAIEAARAGEHGRGFAVVAAEVRKLAERAQESTGQIQEIVVRIRAGTQSTVQATEAGARTAREGADLARQIESVLSHIVGVAEVTNQAAAQISLATRQQTSASGQVVAAMNEVSEVSQRQADSQRDRANTLGDLERLSESLSESIAVFHTNDAKEQSAGTSYRSRTA